MKNGMLIILDGYGEGKPNAYNAVANANTPTLKKLKTMPYSLLKTSGEDVGLFKGDMGGSEVGHGTIGAGRIVPSTLKRIDSDFSSGAFEKNKILLNIFAELKKNNGNLHLVGLMSDKNVHSNINHAYKIIDMAKNKAKNIFLHLITDGRDTPPKDSLIYIKQVKQKIKDIKNCHIVSIGGRGYAMDRENNLDRTLKAYNAMFESKTGIGVDEIESYLTAQHNLGKDDQFIEPVHIQNPKFEISSKDVVFFFNFREDRLRQIVKMCVNLNAKLVTMARVDSAETVELYPVEIVKNTLCEYLSSLNLSQIKITESTKYAHLTYFFNGNREEPFDREDRIHIPSLKVENFASTPKMRAKEITDEAIKAVKKKYNAIIINYSNPDMIGHTGNYEAVMQSLEFLDKCLKELLVEALKNDYVILITADHGNAEQMLTKDGQPHMAHTLNPVFCVALGDKEYQMKKSGGLKDVAPTLLDLMGLEKNPTFEGASLIKN